LADVASQADRANRLPARRPGAVLGHIRSDSGRPFRVHPDVVLGLDARPWRPYHPRTHSENGTGTCHAFSPLRSLPDLRSPHDMVNLGAVVRGCRPVCPYGPFSAMDSVSVFGSVLSYPSATL